MLLRIEIHLFLNFEVNVTSRYSSSLRSSPFSSGEEMLRNARTKARMDSVGIKTSTGEIPAIIFSAKRSVSVSASPVHRSVRLKGNSCEAITETCDCESLENAAISEKKAIMASTGVDLSMGQVQVISSSSDETINLLKPNFVSSCRLKGETCDSECTSPRELLEEIEDCSELVQERTVDASKIEGMETTDDHASGISDYERLRIARISEIKARMASLGVHHRVKELQDIFSFRKPTRNLVKRDLSTPRRRSDRLQGRPSEFGCLTSPDRCGSHEYHPLFRFYCHLCRRKELCDEEECRRCRDQDINQPCLGKTQCSSCHSKKGVLCRACLKIRYGEEIEEVRMNKDWMCPHCIEEKGINPYWICNSSMCLKERTTLLTEIAIDYAREHGYESLAHLIMDRLKD